MNIEQTHIHLDDTLNAFIANIRKDIIPYMRVVSIDESKDTITGRSVVVVEVIALCTFERGIPEHFRFIRSALIPQLEQGGFKVECNLFGEPLSIGNVLTMEIILLEGEDKQPAGSAPPAAVSCAPRLR